MIAARALIERDRDRQADPVLAAVPPGSSAAPEAAFLRARIPQRRGGGLGGYEGVVNRHAGTSWAEEALVTMAHLASRDGNEAAAVPYYRRLLESFPAGRYVERSVWALGWDDYRSGRYAEAAERFEGAAGQTPHGTFESRFLYWAGRSRAAMGQPDLARALYTETVAASSTSTMGCARPRRSTRCARAPRPRIRRPRRPCRGRCRSRSPRGRACGSGS